MADSSSSSDFHAAKYQYMGTYVSRMPTPTPPSLFTSCCSSLRLPSPHSHFRIPPLQSSFLSLLHPHYELVKQHCEGWILDVAQPPSAAACRLLLECLLPRLVCRAIPGASSVSRLIHVTKMIAWLTIADDDDDHPDALGADDIANAQHASRVMDILRRCKEADNKPEGVLGWHPTCSPNLSDGNPLGLIIDLEVEKYANCSKSERKEGALDALTKLWAEMRREMTPTLRHRFVLAMEDYLHAMKVQARFRMLKRLPDMEAYLKIRRNASFILPSFTLLEYALGIELEEEVYNNPLVEKFRTLALDYICLCNDIISCKVEIGVGDYFNMPSIAYNSNANKEWSLQDATDHVASMIKDLDAQCVSMLPLIQQSSLPSLQHSFVNTYINALCSCMAGSLFWFLESARYRDSQFVTSLEN